eukprot:GILJ01005746.1.p1 GENE.GILJ01005746.1~~GILJ01005746.1.p1  ORF type:complete len:283 (-),score=48.82 GILJ01005746.1:226-1005(-)
MGSEVNGTGETTKRALEPADDSEDDKPLAVLKKRKESEKTAIVTKTEPVDYDDDDDVPLSERKKVVKTTPKPKKEAKVAEKKKPAKKKVPEKKPAKKAAAPASKKKLLTTKVRNNKESVVTEVLKRWWYCMPDWPPEDPVFWQKRLRERNLRQVQAEDWEDEPDIDEENLQKVVEVKGYRGIFRGAQGQTFDLRPHELCPCYKNLVGKDIQELYQLLVVALEGQLEALTSQDKYDADLEKELTVLLEDTRKKGGFKKSK